MLRDKLSRREKEVCDLVVRGFTNKEVAIDLRISSRTAEDHRTHILHKYGVRNVVQLVRAVYGIVEVV